MRTTRFMTFRMTFAIACTVALLAASPASAEITCGKGDGAGKVHKHTDKDPNDPNKTLEWYCVDEAYFKIEVKCGDDTTCFAKCVFDGGLNQPGVIDPGGDGWDEIWWYNWDVKTCDVDLDDTKWNGTETAQEHRDRVKQLLLDKDCDFNCYSWSASEGVRLGSREEPPLIVEAYRKGEQVERAELTRAEIDDAFHGANPYLIEDPTMLDADAEGQAANDLTATLYDFEDGVVPANIDGLPGTDPIDVQGGSLYFNVAQTGDGIVIDTSGRHPSCLVFKGLDMGVFAPGNGLGFLLEFESGDSFDVQFYDLTGLFEGPNKKVKVKAKEKKADGTTTEVIRTVKGVSLDEISHVQIDWVPSPDTLLERIEVEIVTKDGRVITQEFRSGLTHTAGATKAYRIRGLDISQDPPILVESLTISDLHTDYVEGHYGNLEIAAVVANTSLQSMPVGRPFKLPVVAVGANGDGLPQRPIEIFTSAGVEIANDFAMVSEDGTAATVMTDSTGLAMVELVAHEPGPVTVEIVSYGNEISQTMQFQAVGISNPTDRPIELE